MTSIRRRILFLLVPLTALAMIAVALGIYVTMARDLTDALDRTVLAMVRAVDAALGVEIDGGIELEFEGASELEFEDGENAFYVVTRADGGVVASSLPSPPARLSGSGEEPTYGNVEVDGRGFRVCTLQVVKEPEDDEEDRQDWLEEHPGEPLPEVDPISFWITAGRSTDELQETQAALRRRLFVGFGALFVALILIPSWVVSVALRPLKDLSSQAQNVGPESPQARLEEAGTDKEVRSLVHAFNQALGRLAAAYERQKRFAADAAHEFRTPLAAIRAHCEVALRTPRNAAQLRKALDGVHHTTLRMGAMVESLLAMTRLEAGVPARMVQTDLSRVAQEAARLNAAAARAKDVRLSVTAPEGIVVNGDEDLLVECVSNLVENAVRYTPAGGSVRVEGGVNPRPFLSVADTGVGIPEEHLDRIFDRFYRVDRARSRMDGGTGLGLCIAREIARIHSAEISVESRPGAGSRVELRMGRPGPGPQADASQRGG